MQVTPNQNIPKQTTATPQVTNVAANPVNGAAQQQQCESCTPCPTYMPPQMPYYPPQCAYYPQQGACYPPQTQNVQVPATSAGVNIQIFNPSAGTPGAPAPTYNVNAPCYPSGYYTGSLGPDGKMRPNGPDDNNNNINNINNINQNPDDSSRIENTNTVTNTNKKTEKRKIVELSDNYIRALEANLNSQDQSIRINAAKEVFDRLEEDDSRHDDKALTALINKMLQDPADGVRVLALAALRSRIVDGDDYTVNVLKKMQQSDSAYGQDAVDASKILLQMTGRRVEKEFEVPETKKTETKKETSRQVQ